MEPERTASTRRESAVGAASLLLVEDIDPGAFAPDAGPPSSTALPSQPGGQRAPGFEDTVEFFSLVLGLRLTTQEKADLVAFMRVL